GERSTFEQCRPIFEAFGKEVVHIDERVGSGQVAKLVNNLILWAGVVAVHESLALAERLGVSPARLRTALSHGSADSYALRELHLVNLTWPHKDLEQAAEVAAEAGAELPLANCVGTLIRTLTREELRRLTGGP
ncbi:MAG TPA: NAD-binding protein, partial [bacterium]|nr:NAD-binding protein [bacterium]